MRNFTKAFLMLLLCTLSVLTTQAKTEKVHATFESPSNTNTSWDAGTKTFTWSTTYYNQLRNIGLPNGDITKYKKLVVDCTIKSGDQFRILIYKGGSNLTLYAKDGVNEFILADTLKALYPNDYNEYLLACDEICLSGNNAAAPGEAVINDMYLETYDDEGEKVYATFENPSNTNTTWNSETKTFTWSTTYYNQLRNIGLPNGVITKYKKLVVDCTIKSGDQFRVLIYKGGSNKTLYASNGVNEFILADTLKALYPNDYNEYLLACDEICLSGNNAAAPGEAVINAVYLETYPENESVEIPEIQYEEDPGKPEGDFVDFIEVFSTLQPRIGLGEDTHPIVLGNGDVVVGQRTKDIIADLSAYSKLTIVTSPNLKLVVYMNHEVDAQQNAGDYAPADSGKYVFLNVQADENGIAEVDLTQYTKQDLNCICLPWDNNNKGTVWYLLLTKKADTPAVPTEVTFDIAANPWEHVLGSGSGETADAGNITEPLIVDGVTLSFDKANASTPARFWIGPEIRIYKDSKMKIAAPEGKAVTKIEFTASDFGLAATPEGLTSKVWEGNSTNVEFVPSKTTKITKIEVTIADKNAETVDPQPVEPVHIANTAETAYTVAKAIELIDAGEGLSDTVFVKGIVSQVDKIQGGAITYWISADGTTEGQQFECYKGKNIDGADFAAIEDVEVGAEVIVKGTLTKYGETYEFNQGNELVSYKAPFMPLFADGKYYIYNVGAQKYLAAGANWGTHAVVNADGLDYIITATDGKYTLDSQVSNGGNNHFLNGEWNDGAAMGWTFAPVEGKEGVYTISNGEKFLTAQENGEVTLADDATAEAAQWSVKTLEARIAELATATAEAPVNATFLIQDANFGRNDLRKSAWKMEASNQNLSGGNNINNNAESYHAVFTLSQTLTNAPAGKYQMTAQGFYRQDDEKTEALPVFYANDKTAEFPAKTGEENSMSMASESFTAGLYTIEPIEVTVFEDGQLTIGAKGTATSQWVIFDNFRLTYLTSEIPADNFKPAYEEALATAQATLAAEDYAIVTGEEKTALETVIAEYETVAEESADNFKVAIVALTEATNAFKEAKAGYEELAAAKEFITMVNFDIRFPYASEAKKAAAQASLNAEALSSVDAYVKAYEIYRTYRQFAESNAKLEGLEDAIDMTQKIVNPKAEEAIAEPWVVVKGEGSGGALNILNNEPWTDGDGNSTHKYFDGGNWGAQAWDVALQQKISLPKGKYLLTVKGRASADVALTLFAGEVEGGIPSLGASGNLFNRGWNDSSIEFELAEADSIVIGVRGVTEAVHNWMSFSDFRLYKFPVELPATASIKPTVGITERFTNVADLEGKAFAIINEADGKALYGTNNQNLGYDTYGSAFSASNSGYLWKLVSLANDADTEVQGYYRFQLVTPAGADYNCWGMGGWLNSQPANQACSFILGLNNQNGQDIKNGAVYDVQYVEGQGFSIKNIGTGLYQGANTLPANAEAPSYFTFAAVGTSYVPAVEALLAEGEGWKAFVKDEAAKSAYDAAVAGIDPAAIEGDGLAEAKTVDAAIVELVKAQPAEEGANFTRAIINPSFELGNADGWTSNDGGRVANNGNFGAATGSFFVEKWTAAPNTLSNGSFLQTIYGLPEGKYKVTAEIQNREQGNGDAAGTGLFLVANEDFTEAIANNGETFEVIGTTHRGILEIGVLIDNCSGNWICFDNFKLTLVETLPAEEPEFANGDVNHDNEVDVTDVVIIIDDILLKNPENFDAALADVNHDNEIDVTDVVLVIDKILGKIELSRGVEASQKDLSAYTAFQMDLTIPAGYVFEGVELTEMAKKSHSLAYNMLSDGRCRVVVFSMDNEALPGAWDEVIRLNLKGQGDAFVNVDRAMFVTVGGERHELLLNGTTSIAQLSTLNSQFSIVYDLQGRKVEKTAKGVYVIDGKKVVK